MQIITLPIYDWGHALDKTEKPKLEKALAHAVENLKPDETKHEVVVIEQPEDRI